MSKRLQIPYLGEFYTDELTIEARLKNRSEVQEAASLLCCKLASRLPERERMIKALADKRGITFDEMRTQLLKGDYEPISQEDIEG